MLVRPECCLQGSRVQGVRGKVTILCSIAMALDQLKAFILKMQQDDDLKQTVLAASTADDVAKIALRQGFEFSGDALLRFSGKTVGQVTVVKPDHPGEYH